MKKKTTRQQRIYSPEVCRNLEVGVDCITRIANALWWDWNAGSTLIYWAWPASHFKWARDGQPHFTIGELSKFKEPQKAAPTTEMMARMKEKVNKVRRRWIAVGYVRSLTNMFAVPNGISDIRMVCNGTSSGLNDALWAPHFGLPVVAQTLRSLMPGYYQVDLDIAEMFLCFNLGVDMRPYAGVDVTLMRDWNSGMEEGRPKPWEHWSRNFMGMKDSPYRSLQMTYLRIEREV